MKQYEYDVFHHKYRIGAEDSVVDFVKNWLNERGEEGWRFFKVDWSSYDVNQAEEMSPELCDHILYRTVSIFAVGYRERS